MNFLFQYNKHNYFAVIIEKKKIHGESDGIKVYRKKLKKGNEKSQWKKVVVGIAVS